MSKDSEYEWTFFYELDNAEEATKDTFKRIKNLYKDITIALDTEMDDNYSDRVNKAYDKFLSKLKKIDYKNYLALQEKIVLVRTKNIME